MKLLFATALLSVIEASQIERGYDRHGRLAGFGIHGYRTRISKPLPAFGLYNTNRSGYYLDHSDYTDDDSTKSANNTHTHTILCKVSSARAARLNQARFLSRKKIASMIDMMQSILVVVRRIKVFFPLW